MRQRLHEARELPLHRHQGIHEPRSSVLHLAVLGSAALQLTAPEGGAERLQGVELTRTRAGRVPRAVEGCQQRQRQTLLEGQEGRRQRRRPQLGRPRPSARQRGRRHDDDVENVLQHRCRRRRWRAGRAQRPLGGHLRGLRQLHLALEIAAHRPDELPQVHDVLHGRMVATSEHQHQLHEVAKRQLSNLNHTVLVLFLRKDEVQVVHQAQNIDADVRQSVASLGEAQELGELLSGDFSVAIFIQAALPHDLLDRRLH
mmetsp:Transcript_100835/g.323618  ORF Transcript_100835/g.323618 Transcript_100835/m.323618 type:complete len:257 (+) Transcript_100835:266-1036(+)